MNTDFRNILIASLLFIVFYNVLIFHTNPGIRIGIFFGVLQIYLFITRNKKSLNITLGILSSIISTVFAFLFAFRDSEVVQFINGIRQCFLLLQHYIFIKNRRHFFRVFFLFFLFQFKFLSTD